jgi:hypothetical protein
MLYFLIGIILTLILLQIIGIFVKRKRWKEAIENAIESQKIINAMCKDMYSHVQRSIDKKNMEEQLRLKLERDDKLKKIDDEILEKLRNIK